MDHGRSDASLPFDGGDRHGGLHPLSEEQGYFQNWCLQELQNTLQGTTVNLFFISLALGECHLLYIIMSQKPTLQGNLNKHFKTRFGMSDKW